ncbi:MAG: diguanylate cyclase [Lachnospiraceae bacterium]|nr:diguanylate cyclase [Lachnospiraceae bacterium]
MIYTALTKKAIRLMSEKHKDQTDKSGLPYVFHPWHVAESMDDELSTCVALLHDVLEDTDTTLDEIREQGFPEEVCEALSLLTHEEGVDYMDYVRKLSENPIARKVKLSDLKHNSDLSRLDEIREKDKLRLEKYKNCIAFLEGKTDVHDYSSFLAGFSRVACILSVDLNKEDGDRFLVVDANDAYKCTVVKDLKDFETNVPYTRYIPKAANFEALCESCVTTDRPIHTYFDIELYNAWMEVFLTPLVSDDPAKGLLLFSYEMNPKADLDKLTDISSETATNVIKTCLILRETNDFQKSMNSVVADIRKQCGAKRCSILLTDFENRKYSLLCEDYDDDPRQIPMSAFLTEEFYRVIETWPKLMNKSNCFIMTNESDMEEAHKIAPEWIDSLRAEDVRSLVIFPLRSDNRTIGYIWAGNFDPAKTLRIKETLSLTAFILSSEIANEQNNIRMKIMSSTDLLTGVLNRNAMNNRISDDLSGEKVIRKPFGVFFIDVNGLKSVNDTKGHLAGDNLLRDVASTLQELKNEKTEIYRVGGDEFMIIETDSSLGEVKKMKEALLSRSERPDRAHYAIGLCHSDEGGNILKAMQTADARMYESKAEYYSRHPEYEWHGNR